MGCCIPPLYKIIYLYVVCAHKNVPVAYGCHSYNIFLQYVGLTRSDNT